MKKDEKILAIIGSLLLIPIAIILNGFVLSKLFEWFISDYFEIKTISIPVAIGISSLLTMMIPTNYKKEESSEISTAIGVALGKPLFALLFGYIITLFM